MSASILPAHQRQQQQGNISESDEDAPDNRPSNYVAPTISTPLPDSISLRAWRDRPANSPTYVPYWTDPAWDPRLEISGSGRQERERFGDVKALSRPAILPEDEARFPTPYARRFGIHRDARPNLSVGYSQMTPTFDTFSRQPPPSSNLPEPQARDIELDESYQRFFLKGYSMDEIVRMGAFASPESLTSDLQGEPHAMFAQNNWSQDFLPPAMLERLDETMRNIRYSVGGVQGTYSALDERVWMAIKPALLIVTRVIESGHPHLEALLSLFHLRPVPVNRDPRPPENREAPYKNYVSVWLEQDQSKMYSSVLMLKQVAFDPRAAVLHFLSHNLRIGFYAGESNKAAYVDAAKVSGHNAIVIMHIQAYLIWPLLHPQYSQSERAASAMLLAGYILHELCHAIRIAFALITGEPQRLSNCGYNVNPVERMLLLGVFNEVYADRFDLHYFFQDEPYGEEGISGDAQFFGGSLASLASIGPETWISILVLYGYPPQHTEPWLWNEVNDRYSDAGSGYDNWLIRAPVACFQSRWPIAVSKITRFFKKDWWEANCRFGYRALRMLPYTTSDEFGGVLPNAWDVPVVSMNEMGDADGMGDLLGRTLQSTRLAGFLGTGHYCIFQFEQRAVAQYLKEFTLDLIRGKVIRRRLHYDRLTWPRKYEQIQTLFNTTVNSFNAVGLTFQSVVSFSTFTIGQQNPTTQDVLQNVRDLMRQSIGSILDIQQVVGRDIQHTTYLITGYFRNDADERRLIHARYMAPLRARLETIRNELDTLQDVINLDFKDGQQSPWEDRIQAKWRQDLAGQPEAERAILDVAQADIAQAANDIRHLIVGLASICGTLDQLIGMLHDAYIADDAPDVNGYLSPVTAAKQSRSLSQTIEMAAKREIAAITDPNLLGLIRAWQDCIVAYQRESQLRGQTRAQLAARRAQAQDSYLQALAKMDVDGRVLDGQIDEAQREQAVADTFTRLRKEMATDPDLQARAAAAATGPQAPVSDVHPPAAQVNAAITQAQQDLVAAGHDVRLGGEPDAPVPVMEPEVLRRIMEELRLNSNL